MIGLWIAVVAYGHHSVAGIATTETVTKEGIVKQFRWANPHSWLEIEVPNGKGGADIWNLEMHPPSYLIRAGWKATSVRPGSKITFTARPFKNGDPGGVFVSLTLPDGKVLSGTPPRESPPSAAPPPQ
jgi:hypothetical protein